MTLKELAIAALLYPVLMLAGLLCFGTLAAALLGILRGLRWLFTKNP